MERLRGADMLERPVILRTDTGHYVVDGQCYSLASLVEAAYDKMRRAGVTNVGFHAPPFFRTGCRYVDAVKRLIAEYDIQTVPLPPDARVEFVPFYGDAPYSFAGQTQCWPEVFGVEDV